MIRNRFHMKVTHKALSSSKNPSEMMKPCELTFIQNQFRIIWNSGWRDIDFFRVFTDFLESFSPLLSLYRFYVTLEETWCYMMKTQIWRCRHFRRLTSVRGLSDIGLRLYFDTRQPFKLAFIWNQSHIILIDGSRVMLVLLKICQSGEQTKQMQKLGRGSQGSNLNRIN